MTAMPYTAGVLTSLPRLLFSPTSALSPTLLPTQRPRRCSVAAPCTATQHTWRTTFGAALRYHRYTRATAPSILHRAWRGYNVLFALLAL